MSTTLQLIMAKAEELSPDELFLLQEYITKQLRQKTLGSVQSPPDAYVRVPGAYRLTPEEAKANKDGLSYPDASNESIYLPTPTAAQLEAELAEIFTSEELLEMEKVNLDDLPPLPKSLSEMINEDREDRF